MRVYDFYYLSRVKGPGVMHEYDIHEPRCVVRSDKATSITTPDAVVIYGALSFEKEFEAFLMLGELKSLFRTLKRLIAP